MAFDPLPPLTPTLTLTPKAKVPPDIPPDPSLSMLFPENTPYRIPNNPFRGPTSKGLREIHKKALQDALGSVRGPFIFNPVEPYNFNGTYVDIDSSSDSFNSAVIMVIAAVERGFCSNRDPAPLGPSDWARLSSALVAAVGRGYHRQYTPDQDAALERMRAGATDPDPLLGAYPTFFHRLGATAEGIAFDLEVDAHEGIEGYQEWYSILKNDFTVKATKAAAAEVEEKWRTWKANELDRLAEAERSDMATKTREQGVSYLIETAQRLGLQILQEGNTANTNLTPFAGRKRTVSGSTPKAAPSAPPTPKATRVNPPRLAKRTASTSPAPQGRVATPNSQPIVVEEAPPTPPTPRPRKRTLAFPPTLKTGTDVGRPAQVPLPASPSATLTQPDTAALTATVLTKILARLEALEKKSMPPPMRHPEARNKLTQRPISPQGDIRPLDHPGEYAPASRETREVEEDFTLVSRNGRGRKGKGKVAQPQINTPSTSYASAAAAAANTKQPVPPPPTARLPAITEVTIIRNGAEGHPDPQVEESIRARAADAIVREVRLKMGKAVANPIPLRAGRWSVQQRSKGNFVYSFDGHIPFDLLKSYERMLLTPFHGTGKLSPSMGWTRLLAHGVPVYDDYYCHFGPEALLKEVKAMPGLKRAHFAMPPRWLKPINRINSEYSTITFAISDPDGSVTSALLNGRAALFGKEVIIQRWVDKPALVQCSHCHALGHIRTSRACPLGKDSVKCYICGGSHLSDTHDQKCPRKHAVAGICDCGHFKCLNCHKTGHTCKDTRCPARDLFRPRASRRPRKPKNNGKERDWAAEREPSIANLNPTMEDAVDSDEDLYHPAPLPPNPTARQIKAALYNKSIANLCKMSSRSRVDENNDSGSNSGLAYDLEKFPEAWSRAEPMDTDPTGPTEYSPSHRQGDATDTNLA
jgi:hypothetical protein